MKNPIISLPQLSVDSLAGCQVPRETGSWTKGVHFCSMKFSSGKFEMTAAEVFIY